MKMPVISFRKFRQAKSKATALDALCARVMLADLNLNITFVNDSLSELLKGAEQDIKAELPRFAMSTLIGSNFDIFDKTPTHLRTVLAVTEKPHSAMIKVGHHVFDLMVIPLRQGNRKIGFAVEWSDAKTRLQSADFSAQMAAISRNQAVIEFTAEGVITAANANILHTFGYQLEEVVGKHHRMLVPASEANSAEYIAFWEALGRGEHRAAAFKRVKKDGSVLWIQGTYNPILDSDGKVVKIVKYATDITDRVNAASRIGSAMTALAEGDLVQRLDTPLTPEFEQLRANFNAAMQTLQDTMRQLSHSAATIQSGSEEIRQSSDDLSRRTEQQAASLEQVAATLDQITTTVKSASTGAVNAQAAVATVKTDAEKSAILVRQAVDAMHTIEKSSVEIGQIIGVIDEIAFQTNLLALNAGVEAARAGDAGRGFAVVASEVRALAQRSADAAKQIKTLISASTRQVVEGVRLVGETGKSIEGIDLQVGNINTVVAAIAASARDQSTSLAEINSAMGQMDQVTQQNAAMVEESTAASHTLANETQNLAEIAARFRTGDERTVTNFVRPAAAPPSRPKPAARAPKQLKVVGGSSRAAASSNANWEEF